MTTQHRASFKSQYASPATMREAKSKTVRLLDCLLCIADQGHREFFAETKPEEFAVIDVLTKSKAWFDRMGRDTDQIEAMISSHFGVRAFRADTRLWLV